MTDTGSHDSSAVRALRAANRRTALVLLSIVLVFFVGVFATRLIADANTGIAVIGSAVLLFLVVAIGRNLRAGPDAADADAATRARKGARR